VIAKLPQELRVSKDWFLLRENMKVKGKIVATYSKEEELEASEEKEECPSGGDHVFKHAKREGEFVCVKCGYVPQDHTFGQLGRGTRKGSGGTPPSYLKR
jgi:ribosomal protein S27AE